MYYFNVSLLSILFCFTISPLYASISSIQKCIAQRDYTKANILLQKEYSKNSNNYAYDFLYAQYYSSTLHPAHAIDSALFYINKCTNSFKQTNDAKRIKANTKAQIDSNAIMLMRKNIELELYYRTKKINSIEEYERVLKLPIYDTFIRSQFISSRNSLAFTNANKSNDFYSFKQFMEQYPDADQAGEAKQMYEKLLFEHTIKVNTWQGFKAFIDEHPNTLYTDSAQKKYDLLLYNDYIQSNDNSKLYEYIVQFPKTPYRTLAESLLFKRTCIHLYDDELYSFIKKYPKANTYVDKAWKYLYHYHTSDDNEQSYISFAQNNPEYPFKTELSNDYKKCFMKPEAYEQEEKFGYVVNDTLKISAPIWLFAGDFTGKYAIVSNSCTKDKCRYFAIDKNLQNASSVYDELYEFHDAVAVAGYGDCPENNCLYGVIHEIGDTIIPFIYESIFDAHDGRMLANTQEGKSGFFDTRGNIVIPFIYNNARNFKNYFAYVSKDTVAFFIDTAGNRQVQLPYFKQASDFVDGLCTYSPDGILWGVCKSNGSIIHPPLYKSMITFINGIAIANREDAIVKKGKTSYVLNTYQLDLNGNALLQKK